MNVLTHHDHKNNQKVVESRSAIRADDALNPLVCVPSITIENIFDAIEMYLQDNNLALADQAVFRVSVEVNVKDAPCTTKRN